MLSWLSPRLPYFWTIFHGLTTGWFDQFASISNWVRRGADVGVLNLACQRPMSHSSSRFGELDNPSSPAVYSFITSHFGVVMADYLFWEAVDAP